MSATADNPVDPSPPKGSESTEPLKPRSCLGAALALAGALAGGVYLLNPGWGLFELVPDYLPGVGNLDEAGATALVIFALRYLFTRRR